MKILVIEDEKLLADSIKSMLERKGFQVECVYDGESGKEYAELGFVMTIITLIMGNMIFYLLDRILGRIAIMTKWGRK